MRKALLIGVIALLVLFSGCSDDGDGGGDGFDLGSGTTTDPGSGFGGGPGADGDGGDGEGGDGAPGFGAGAEACSAGQQFEYSDPQSGERVSMEMKGMVSHDGRDVCKATWEVSGNAQAQYSLVEMFFDPAGEYQKLVYYDAQGNVIHEFEASGTGSGPFGGDSDGTDSAADGSDGVPNVGGDSWCPEGQTTSFTDPESGEQMSLEVQGVVDHRGHRTCKSVWETNQADGEIYRMEMFTTRDSNYMHILYYDAQGNVVDEIEFSG